MYTSRGFREWEIGDIDVVRRGRTFHLFHLVLPNHDYIAHAVSQDGMTWTRTRNAIFTGEPGSWDDDMLWTMHVSLDPVRRVYEMFYTGLHRAENGFVQRIGRAVSRDLLRWRKENEHNLPLHPSGSHYEGPGFSERGWISFRDPFLLRQAGQEWMLLCARVLGGQVNRRGCVGLVRRTADGYHLEPPLFYPRMYDDIECPCLVELEGTYYLIGSIREDVEVHYWWCETFRGEYRAFNDNVLMPKGNYAARIMRDGHFVLVYTFYIDGLNVESGTRSLPPPKQLRRRSDGKLELVSYHRWSEKLRGAAAALRRDDFKACLENPTATVDCLGERMRFACRSGFELFTTVTAEPFWICDLEWQTLQPGGCGLVFNLDDLLNGFFVSLDTERGSAQIRAWGSRPERVFQNYIYETLQNGEFTPIADRRYALRLIRWGSYIELSVNGVVRLSLVDARFSGRRLGFFLESAEIALSSLSLRFLEPPNHGQP
ncbi:MAG: glycosyl hydrolase family 32 [Holophaga sp.]|jgi:beta-fructofuranosidase